MTRRTRAAKGIASRGARPAARVAKARATLPKSSSRAGDVDAYFARVPEDSRRKLRQLRAIIRALVPDTVEWFSYGIPGFRLHNRPFIWYAAFRDHVSLFPMTTGIRTAFASDLERLGLETSKGTIRFALDRPLPVTLIKRLVKARLAEM